MTHHFWFNTITWWADEQRYKSDIDPEFGQGGAPTSETESCQCSELESIERREQSVARDQDPLKVLEAFGFLMLKYAFSYILETLFL